MNRNIIQKQRITSDQRGMVAIMVTIVIMMVIGLIVVGFTRVIRRDQRQTLDRQLSTQAFYAAEAGVNDVSEQIPGILASDPDYEKTTCGNDAEISNTELDVGTGVVVTCTLVDPSPPSLIYGNINHESKIVPIISNDPTEDITQITITWRDEASRDETFPAAGTNCDDYYTSSTNRFPASGWNCTVGILRVDLVPTETVSRASLRADAFTTFLYPGSGGGTSMTYAQGSTSNQGSVTRTTCTVGPPANPEPAVCTMTINTPPRNSFHLRMRTLYGTSNVTITARGGAATNYELKNAQALIDVTGKANDVLRRIQVRVAANELSRQNLPDFAIQATNDICKRFRVIPNANYVDSECPADPF